MSLTLCVTTAEGIVLSADSRQTYKVGNGPVRIGSDSVTKIIPVTKWVGVTVAGPAFLEETPGNPQNISSIIKRFSRDIDDNSSVDEVAKILKEYLEKLYNPKEQIKKIKEILQNQIALQKGTITEVDESKSPERIKILFQDANGKPGTGEGRVDQIALIVAGYDNGEGNVDNRRNVKVNIVHIPGETEEKRKKGQEFGAVWSGQTDIIQRIIKGNDGSIFGCSFVNEAIDKHSIKTVQEQLNKNEYHINWGTMSIFDAIDFAELMIETTSAIQRFANGTIRDLETGKPGLVPGVGKPIDVAVITPEEGFVWHKRKKLQKEPAFSGNVTEESKKVA